MMIWKMSFGAQSMGARKREESWIRVRTTHGHSGGARSVWVNKGMDDVRITTGVRILFSSLIISFSIDIIIMDARRVV